MECSCLNPCFGKSYNKSKYSDLVKLAFEANELRTD